MASKEEYLLSGGAAELERLRLQARVWEPDAEIMLDRIGVQAGWSCLDLGCGGMGILGPLSRRVGISGRVLGVDVDAEQLVAARAYVDQLRLPNVQIEERDAFRCGLPRVSYDLVHARFLAAPTGRGEELVKEMVALARPGGIVALQEPDTSSWRCYPPRPEFDRLRDVVVEAFKKGGGNFDVGRDLFGLLRKAGLRSVTSRAAVQILYDGHPYIRLPMQFATSLRTRILETGLMDPETLDATVAACEGLSTDPEVIVLTFTVIQAWGQKPGPGT